ncbi:MAG: SLBB domain-containing protein [Theionarchaea archaeon]|nr:SLBB domain-containing protein [Theionarchaea archaeon]MBU7000494.1 SLBB domain-containing protein [Theionarchaea archaeon]MBU7019980.1 SLBB domain-containing protein [Theionarchaea archaeon]MBU7036188.1 SLBB domain-containing protein [Theionarchaea archaeon]
MNERIVLRNVDTYTNPTSVREYTQKGGYGALKKCLATDPESVVGEVEKSRLRGRGGAGFPTGTKWRYAASSQDITYIVANADEGEPGAFKDRLIMEGDPHKVLEGIIIAGYAVGASRGFLYVRGEYSRCLNVLEEACTEAREHHFLGEKIAGSDFCFDIEVRQGAGSYVCGEETAMISSLEGKRGTPRIRPPYPTSHGLFGNPTVINNVETLANIPSIIMHGGKWFSTIGTPHSTGTKLFPVSGAVETPGCYELPMGTPLENLILEHAGGMKKGKELKAVLVGGAAAGTFLGRENLDIPLSFEHLNQVNAQLGSGVVVVLDSDTCILDVLIGIMEFFVRESCGLCVPCRVGTLQIHRLLKSIAARTGVSEGDINRILSLARVMNKTCLCPLGQSVIMPLQSGLNLEVV